MRRFAAKELACREMVEFVTDYLEGRLAESDCERFEAHLAKCDACTAYVDQMRQTLAALGRIPEETISARARDELVAAFEDFHRAGA